MMHNQLDTLPTTLLESWTPPQPGRLAELAIKSIRYVSVRRIRASAAERASAALVQPHVQAAHAWRPACAPPPARRPPAAGGNLSEKYGRGPQLSLSSRSDFLHP